MAKKSIATMSIEALIELRDQITNTLTARATDLQRQLARLGGGDAPVRRRGRPPGKRSKVAPKYRGPNGETWSGRGLPPKWLAAEIKAGKKREEFLIEGNSVSQAASNKQKRPARSK